MDGHVERIDGSAQDRAARQRPGGAGGWTPETAPAPPDRPGTVVAAVVLLAVATAVTLAVLVERLVVGPRPGLLGLLFGLLWLGLLAAAAVRGWAGARGWLLCGAVLLVALGLLTLLTALRASGPPVVLVEPIVRIATGVAVLVLVSGGAARAWCDWTGASRGRDEYGSGSFF